MNQPCDDKIVELNVELLRDRSKVGQKKYGVTLEKSNLTHGQFLRHALEEVLDLANYLQGAIQGLPEPAKGMHPMDADCTPKAHRNYISVKGEPFVTLQESRDGVWAHFSASGKKYSCNLSVDSASRPFALAYHAAVQAASGAEPVKDELSDDQLLELWEAYAPDNAVGFARALLARCQDAQ